MTFTVIQLTKIYNRCGNWS